MRYEIKQWYFNRFSWLIISVLLLIIAFTIFNCTVPIGRYEFFTAEKQEIGKPKQIHVYMLDTRSGKSWIYSDEWGHYWLEISR